MQSSREKAEMPQTPSPWWHMLNFPGKGVCVENPHKGEKKDTAKGRDNGLPLERGSVHAGRWNEQSSCLEVGDIWQVL